MICVCFAMIYVCAWRVSMVYAFVFGMCAHALGVFVHDLGVSMIRVCFRYLCGGVSMICVS